MTLRSKLWLSTVLAIVMGDMIGSGIFFTAGELAGAPVFWLLSISRHGELHG